MKDRRVAVVVLLAFLIAALPLPAAVAAPPRPSFMQDNDRLQGADRYNTAVAVSHASFPATAPAVVLACGMNPYQAEIGMSLAGAVGGPVLLTPPTQLPAVTATELNRLEPSRVFVLGSIDAVNDAVIAQVQALAFHPTVTRLDGDDKFQVAEAVAKQVRAEVGGTLPNGAFLLYGGMDDWTTLAALAPYAYSHKMPILLSWYSHVSTEAAGALAAGDHVIVANSEYYQSPEIEQKLTTAGGDSTMPPGITVERVRETGRLGLAPAMAQHAVDAGWASYADVVLGTSANFPDNLTAGVYAGVRNGVFLFVEPPSIPFSTSTALIQHASDVPTLTLTVMGSSSVVPQSVVSQIYALGSSVPSGSIAGTVTAAAGGAPLGGIRVSAWGWDPTSVSSTVFFSAEATTAADGSYRIPGLEGRRYYVMFQDPSHAHVDESYKHAPSVPGCGDQVVVTAGGDDAVASTALLDSAGWKSQLVSRISGSDRYQTAIEISKRNYQSADTAVLVTGGGFADALSASSLCGAYQAPLFLVRYDSLPDGLVAELHRLGVKNVLIVGSERVVSNAVVTALAQNGISLKDRVGGANRFATSAAVYEHLKSHGFGVPSDPFIARGDTFPDALAAAPAAFTCLRPILLVNPTSVPAEIAALFNKYKIPLVRVMGSESAVSVSVLQGLAGANQQGIIYYYRYQGANRYATAANFVSAWYNNGTPVFAGIATGLNFPDALSGGVLAGSRGGALLLTPPTSLDPGAKAVLQSSASASTLWSVRIFGGTNVVGSAVESAVTQTLGASGAAQTLGAPGVLSVRPDGPVVEPGPKGTPEVVYAR